MTPDERQELFTRIYQNNEWKGIRNKIMKFEVKTTIIEAGMIHLSEGWDG